MLNLLPLSSSLVFLHLLILSSCLVTVKRSRRVKNSCCCCRCFSVSRLISPDAEGCANISTSFHHKCWITRQGHWLCLTAHTDKRQRHHGKRLTTPGKSWRWCIPIYYNTGKELNSRITSSSKWTRCSAGEFKPAIDVQANIRKKTLFTCSEDFQSFNMLGKWVLRQ